MKKVEHLKSLKSSNLYKFKNMCKFKKKTILEDDKKVTYLLVKLEIETQSPCVYGSLW